MSKLQFLCYARDAMRTQLRGQQIMCRIAQDKYREALQCETIIPMCEGIIHELDQKIDLELKRHKDISCDLSDTIPDLWIPDEVLDEIDQKDAKK